MRVVTFKIDETLLEELDRVARLMGVSRSELIREAIIMFLKKFDRGARERLSPKVIRINS